MSIELFNHYHNEFATYSNMAKQNLIITLNYFAHILGYKENKTDEAHILQSMILKKIKERPDKMEMYINLFYKYFPFLIAMSDVEQQFQKSEYKSSLFLSVFNKITEVLSFERDKSSHYKLIDSRTTDPKFIEEEKIVSKYLNHCWTASIRLIKERFNLDSDSMKFLTDKRYIHRKINYNYYYSVQQEDGRLTDFGKIFLICLLIDKKYITMFLNSLNKQNEIYRNYDESKRKILREVFSAYRIKLPKEKLNNERNDIILALDMLNELKKCPRELFDHISRNNQNKFRVISELEENEVLQKRFSDRFQQLALRYIDEMKSFNNIRFQVNIGTYHYCFTPNKYCMDGITRLRVIDKDINCFGRLNEIESIRTDNSINAQWDGAKLVRKFEDVEPDSLECLPYINDCKAHYVLNGDRIAMSWAWEKSKNKKIKKLNPEYYIPSVSDNIPCLIPKCQMSIYEFPAMIFYLILSGRKNTETENIITTYVKHYKDFLEAIEDGKVNKIKCVNPEDPQPSEYQKLEEEYRIKWRDIPDKIKDFLTGRQRPDFNFYAKIAIDKMIEKNESLLRRFNDNRKTINTKYNKIGKKSYIDIRPGKLAVFLAKDIVFLQPTKGIEEEKGRDKVTGLNYRVLQASIAQYDAQFGPQTLEDFIQMFRNVGILDSDHKHPFLRKVLNRKPQNTIDFYQYYLEERLDFLKRIKIKENYTNIYFLHSDRIKWAAKTDEYYKKLAERYHGQPIELPRGLFEEAIKQRLKNIATERGLEKLNEILSSEHCNVAYMILSYFKEVENDSNQGFYYYKRNYKIFDLLQENKEQIFINLNNINPTQFKNAIPEHISKLKIQNKNKFGRINSSYRSATQEEKEIEKRRCYKYYKEYVKNEKTLRMCKIEDILLFMMAKDIFEYKNITSKTPVKDFKLKDISPKGNSILELEIPFSMKIKLDNGEEKIIKQDSIKIKRYGEFFYYLYDTRVKTLLPNIKAIEIDKATLDRELENYDITRPFVSKLILDFEKSILDSNPKLVIDLEKNPELAKTKSKFINLLQYKKGMSENDKNFIRSIRNAFSHNYYPDKNKISYDNMKLPYIATTLGNDFEKKIKS